jgi:acetyl-CoA synthetase
MELGRPIVPSGESYDAIRSAFRWRIPAVFNIGVACSDLQRRDAAALIEWNNNGVHRVYNFGDLADASTRFANALAGLGLRVGDRVALMLPQSFAAAAVHLGIYKAGSVALPLSQLFGPDAVRHRLADSGARALVVSPESVEGVAELSHELGIVVIVQGDTASAPHLALGQLLGESSSSRPDATTTSETPAFLIYTSGTTASPKGVLHAQRALIGHLPGFELSHGFFPKEHDVFWTPADWAWIGGLMDALMPTLYLGRPIVAGPAGRFDPELAARLIVELKVKNVFIPPTALRVMEAAGISLPTDALRTAMSGGEALGAATLAWARGELGVTVAEIYGQTEANYLVGNSPGNWDVRPGSMGRPYPGHDVRILDEGGSPVAAGTVGEIAVATPDPVAFLNYLNAPQATSDKYVGTWLRTGDVAVQDEDGYLWFKGRADDLIISSGYRISPLEVEQCLLQHPAVAAVAVVGVADGLRGQVVKAFVVPRGTPATGLAVELQAFVRRQLAAYEYPREVEFVDALPTTVTGKIQRRALVDDGVEH